MFVKRDAEGKICAASLECTADIDEAIAADSDELKQFVGAGEGELPRSELEALQASDLALARVLEDLIDILIDKHLIQFTDLPVMAQQKLLTRQGLRRQCLLDLLGDGEDDQIPML